MELSDLKKQWSELSEEDKLYIIENSNIRRIKSFEVRKKIRSTAKAKSTSKRRRSKKVSTNPNDLLALLEKMTPEEKENFLLMTGVPTADEEKE